jgi:hypothetical protein
MNRCRRGRDRMVVGFTTTYAIITYHNWCCEFEYRSGRMFTVECFVCTFRYRRFSTITGSIPLLLTY